MRRFLIAALLLSTPAFAQRPIFPDDYKPSACAPANACLGYPESGFRGAGASFFGYDLDVAWMQAHQTELRAAFEPWCRKLASCLPVPNNPVWFCTDMLRTQVRHICDEKYRDIHTHDSEQCLEFADIFSLGVDQHAAPFSKAAHECSAKTPVQHTKPPEVWMVPDPVPYGYRKDVVIYALDPDTHVPVYAKIKIEDHILYAPSNPAGELASYYPFQMPFHFLRVPNADGHRDVVAPMVTVAADGYPEVKFRLNTPTPKKVTVEMTPPASKLHRGENKVTVTTSVDGRPVEMRVMAGERAVGESNQPITIDWPKGEKRPEIWVTSMFNRYNDVVVAK